MWHEWYIIEILDSIICYWLNWLEHLNWMDDCCVPKHCFTICEHTNFGLIPEDDDNDNDDNWDYCCYYLYVSKCS